MYECIECGYHTIHAYHYKKHTQTLKHQRNVGSSVAVAGDPVLNKRALDYVCKHCDKLYKSVSGLWKHYKICNSSCDKVAKTDNELIKIIMEENAKLHRKNEKLYKDMKSLIPHQTNNNITNNNKFNINIFLNETCKDAMNISDFIKTLQITLADVNFAGENGVLSSSRNLIMQGLEDMDVSERPIHCTDVKRSTMYIKDEGEWNKDNDNAGLKKTIQHVSSKHVHELKQWEAEHPDYMDSESGIQDYIDVVTNITKIISTGSKAMSSAIKTVGEKTHIS